MTGQKPGGMVIDWPRGGNDTCALLFSFSSHVEIIDVNFPATDYKIK